MMGGGLLWAFDIGNLEEFRRSVGSRRVVGGEWKGREEKDQDEEAFEKWIASLTGRKAGGGTEERRWSARGPDEEERAREERHTVVEPQATIEREKPR